MGRPHFHWQYQAKVEVDPPGFFVAKDLDWLRDTERPVFVPPPPIVYDIPFVLDPALHIEENLDWLPEPNQPSRGPQFPTIVYQPMPIEPGGFAGLFFDFDWLVETNRPAFPAPIPIQPEPPLTIEQELFLPFVQDWLRETNQPIFIPPKPTHFDVPFVVDDDIAIVKSIDWFRPIQQPLFDVGRRVIYDVSFVLDPTLHVEVNLDWLRPAQQPLFDVGFRTFYEIPFVLDPTLYIEQNLDWLVEAQRPPRGAARYEALYGITSATEALWAGGVTWTTLGDTFLYTATNWRRVAFWFEAKFRASAGTSYARVFDLTTSAAIANSELSTTSTTFVRLRTAVALSLTDGDEYVAQVGATAFGGDVGDIRAAKLIGIET